jgi:hypothetical protein
MMRTGQRTSPGLALVKLLLVIAISAIGTALLLPAVVEVGALVGGYVVAQPAWCVDQTVWERIQRTVVCDSPRRARYPSIARASGGDLLVLFTQQTAQQEQAGRGDLLLARSTNDGQSWSKVRVVHSPASGEPRAIGTMSRLESGQIVAPFAEWIDSGAKSRVRLLTSHDNGDSWQVSDPNMNCPLFWWTPCGKLIETPEGTLVMPIHGAISQADLMATIHNCGLLRSRDGGKTWGDFTWIARGAGRVIGAAPSTRFSFQGLSIQPLGDGGWLAMVTARRLSEGGTGPTSISEGPGAPQVLCRLWSSDQGRTWDAVEGATVPEAFGGYTVPFGVLRRGRWLAATCRQNQPYREARVAKVDTRGGYPTFKVRGYSSDVSMVVSYSDDEGKTWQAGELFKGPFQWAQPTVNRFVENSDGTVVLSIHGCVTDEEVSSSSSSNGLIRSTDGGETWGDFSFVYRTHPKGPEDLQPEPRFCEMDFLPLTSGNWVAFSRGDRLTMGPKGWAATHIHLSTDRGRTWKKTGATLIHGGQQKLVLLPDGGIAFTYRSHSWQQPGVVISYDEGHSFEYALAGPYDTMNAFAHGEEEFLVFTRKSHRSDMSAGVYRWVPGRN